MPKLILPLLTILMLSFFDSNAQNPKIASCINTSFDKKVHALIKYKIPVLDVDSLAGKTSEYLILDTRAKEEFDISRLPNAQFAGFKKFNIKDWKGIDKNQPIVVYCSVGYRSEKIGKRLEKAGFVNVYNLYGGIFEWVNRFHVLAEQGQSVHTYNKKWSKWLFNKNTTKVW